MSSVTVTSEGLRLSWVTVTGPLSPDPMSWVTVTGPCHRTLDGSDHDWFEGRGPKCVLILYIDDATSRLLYAQFVDVEDHDPLQAPSQPSLGSLRGFWKP